MTLRLLRDRLRDGAGRTLHAARSAVRPSILASVRLASAGRNLLIAGGLGVGAQNVWPDTALLVACSSLFLLAIIDRIRRAA